MSATSGGTVAACVVGSLNADLVLDLPTLPVEGETVIGTGLRRLNGGKGANQAMALARLGADVSMVGRVGQDGEGARLVEALQGEGVDAGTVLVTPSEPTGLAVITLDAAGRNAICVIPGANARLDADQVSAAVQGHRPALVVTQLEIPLPAAEAAMAGARAAGALAVLNAAPIPAQPLTFLAGVDVLVVNEVEAAALAAAPGAGVPEIARQLLAAGPGVVAVTLGGDGCVIASADGLFEVPALAVPVVDTTGAGDCFVAALAVRLAEGAAPQEAARFATAAAALAVQAPGAQAGLPRRGEVTALLRTLDQEPDEAAAPLTGR